MINLSYILHIQAECYQGNVSENEELGELHQEPKIKQKEKGHLKHVGCITRALWKAVFLTHTKLPCSTTISQLL